MRLINLCSEKSRIYSERKKYFHLQSTTYFCHSATEFLIWKVTVMKQQTWQATFKEGWWISMKKYPKEEELNTKITELALYNLFYILLAVVSVGCDRLQIKRIILFQFYPQQHCWCELSNWAYSIPKLAMFQEGSSDFCKLFAHL